MSDQYYVAVTAIVIKDGKFLITKRHPDKKRWPNKWTVPGGRLERSDFVGEPTDINNQWYDTLLRAARREVMEEVGLEVDNFRFLRDIAIPDTVILSFVADWSSGEVKLQEEEATEYAWVSAQEAEEYDLIDGLLQEIKDAHILFNE